MGQKPTADEIAADIRGELRSILRHHEELYKPIRRFDVLEAVKTGQAWYRVVFDESPPMHGIGMKLGGIGTLALPDERIWERLYSFASQVWHLKDRLYQFAEASGQAVSHKDFNQRARTAQSLPICADITNWKKHGRHENFSGLEPRLGLVKFKTGDCGAVDYMYDGARKEKNLIVEKAVPISYSVDIERPDESVIGDARDTMYAGFLEWLPTIRQFGVLEHENSEATFLRNALFPTSGPQT